MKIEELIAINQKAFYTFDIAVLKERIRYIREHMPENISICYAVKANSFVVREIADDVERIEICSHGEANICRALKIESSKMVISGVSKSDGLIDELVSDPDFCGILTAESIYQYERIASAAEKCKRTVNILLRLTNDSQFGMDEEAIESVISQRYNNSYINILGIQYFSGTQKTSVKKLEREIKYLDQYLNHLRECYNYEAKELEYGTGFPVSYFESETLNEDALFAAFCEIIDNMSTKPKITIELGRSIAASCGNYYTHIVDIKKNKGQNYIIVDGGMHQIVYFGQQMAMKRPFMEVAGKCGQPAEEQWNICGSLCTMNDFIVKQMPLPSVQTGDVLCFHNTGAYCMTEGISLFLSRDIPAIYLIKENSEIICVRKSYETSDMNTPYYERNKNNG